MAGGVAAPASNGHSSARPGIAFHWPRDRGGRHPTLDSGRYSGARRPGGRAAHRDASVAVGAWVLPSLWPWDDLMAVFDLSDVTQTLIWVIATGIQALDGWPPAVTPWGPPRPPTPL